MSSAAIFYFFAVLAVVSAVLVVLQKNAMHSVLYLAFTVLSVAKVFLSLQAEYPGRRIPFLPANFGAFRHG